MVRAFRGQSLSTAREYRERSDVKVHITKTYLGLRVDHDFSGQIG